MTVAGLLRDYRAGTRTPAEVVDGVFARIEAEGALPVWISLADRDETVRRASSVDLSLPLAGIPFAVKDNIDVEGLPTTAACPSFAYAPARDAGVVSRLVAAGAIVIGKTNLDQFATGLVGVRSPYGACANVYDERYISGGSSSGSAVAVARGLVPFSLGTDTAGSGRVPAAFNNLVGLKPTRGLLSTHGVVPACRSLDCVSVFTRTAEDADLVWRVARGPDVDDPFSRVPGPGDDAAPWAGGAFRFGVPRPGQLAFFDDPDTPGLFARAIERLTAIGGTAVEVDCAPFLEAASLLYAGPWVAERTAAIGEFLDLGRDDVHPVVGDIIAGGRGKSAVEAYRSGYRLQELIVAARPVWTAVDVLVVPTAGTIYTRAAVEADPVGLNTSLGYYTNFVNLMDLAAVAVPAGFRPDGLPFGISLVGRAFSDEGLLTLASRLAGEARPAGRLPGCVTVAVVGAHLSGEPLNWQLTDRGARLVQTTSTSSDYRLFALAETTPPKPGLVREPGFAGLGIEVEVWAVPEDAFGSFVNAVPPPLGVGSVRLASGDWVKGFICEAAGLAGARDITDYGGWRAYRHGRTLMATSTINSPARASITARR
ncbi:MAG: allophanate hydrolase [Vicinamibacterales bacterium]|nr:allophanate hydrolase [Vicinamibacterales bacterium]